MKTATNNPGELTITVVWMDKSVTLTLDEAIAITAATLKFMSQHPEILK